ncbi:hypothetical protein RAZWK3B_08341 [Roseobacter sp. AzwK-3b]|uniref:C40 family peptidase n=1 Tax=Roseobacter sp. AzwK-3b TaxID=351016 RepID=UPI0001568F89|nr:TIGR02594 family protein [Roseobacter sp. AzwK-3b]EDM72244.1 hypothetical protein RAZWK3B_08341 [Roseobacter sp. AzwK-3b]
MTPYEIAQGYIGATEGPGPENNPTIMEMYASVGHDWVEHDSVAWCAAFVGHCLEKAGLRSTRQLTARSYLTWGIGVARDDARPGDIAVFPRGAKSWQGHVVFVHRIEGGWLWGLGGNHGDAVSIKRFALSKMLGVRRAGQVAPAVQMSVRDVQSRLKALGYHEVGAIDGIIGPRTRAAILAFRDDNSLPRMPVIDVALKEALRGAPPRDIAPERAQGAPERSRIINAANAQIGLGAVGAAGSLASQLDPVLRDAETAQGLLARLMDSLGVAHWAPTLLPLCAALVFALVIFYALRARAARLEDHQSGKTP